jgi:predicted nucleic acid-binding protein
VIVLDTSVTYALADRRDARHAEVVAWYEHDRPELVTTPLVLAEVDYLIGHRLGHRAQASLWADVAAGAYLVDWWPSAAAQIAEVAQRWSELDLGLTDASLIAVADRYETLDVATLDHRHFRAVRSLDGEQPFRLLPADA